MKHRAFAESRKHVIGGLALLGVGCLFLLAGSFLFEGLGADIAAWGGGALLLAGNGRIIYGLLIYAGNP